MIFNWNSSNNIKESRNLYEKACDLKANGEYREAIKLFEKSISLDPNYVEPLNNLGNVYISMSDYKKALEYFNKGLSIKPNDAILLNNAAICLMEINDLKVAQKMFEKALEVNPQFFQAYNNLGKLYSLKGDLPSAKRAFKKALEINPFYTQAQMRLEAVEGLLSQQNGTELLKEVNKQYFNTADSQSVETLLNKANSFNLNGQYGDAIFYYEKALKINPNLTEALCSLSYLYITKAEYQKAIDSAKKVIAISPNNKEAFYQTGVSYYYLGKYDLAIKTLRQFLLLADSDMDIFDGSYISGICHIQLEQYNEAIEILQKIVTSNNPLLDKVLYALADAHLSIGNTQEGELLMKKAANLKNEEALKWFAAQENEDILF